MRSLAACSFHLVALCLFAFIHFVSAVSWDASPFVPGALPLAVRSPYLSAWLGQGGSDPKPLNAAWPTFWSGPIVGWAAYAMVDQTAYQLMGDANLPGSKGAVQKSAAFTPTQTTFVLTAGGVDVTLNFVNPVEPNDLVKQSFPFSYFTISAVANDGGSHPVKVYSDISGEWLTSDLQNPFNWTTSVGDVITHQTQLVNQTEFLDLNDRVQQGSVYWSTTGDGVLTGSTTWQVGADTIVRAQFIHNGALNNTSDMEFRNVSDHFPVFAMTHDLGQVQANVPSNPAVWSIGHVRDPAVQYITGGGVLQSRSLYFWTAFSKIEDAISSFLGDFSNAIKRASAFDAQLIADANEISTDYAQLVSLGVSQAFGASEITVSKGSDGKLNASDVLVFTKEISSSGDASTVDVLAPMWPLYLYTNATLAKYSLLPLLEYQASGQYPNPWSVHDLGGPYPKAPGHNDGKDLALPIEESGNMLIMTLGYTQKTNDKSLIITYFNLLDQWTQVLINSSLTPPNQFSTDVFAGSLANQTNLAIKGIIGIKAMSVIAGLAGDNNRRDNYSAIATSYAQRLLQLGTSSDGSHLTLSYGNDSSWGLTYNLYADKLLGTNVFPQSVVDMQSNWYGNVTMNSFGLPLDTRNTFVLSGWEIWTAAFVSSTKLRNDLIGAVRRYAGDSASGAAYQDWYQTTDGTPEKFTARPVVGAHLALLAIPGFKAANASSVTSTVPLANPTSVPPGPPGANSATTSAGPTTTSATSSASKTPFQGAICIWALLSSLGLLSF